MKYLVSNDAQLDKKDRYGRTAMTYAVMNGAAHVASFFLSLGIDADKADSSGNTYLHYACAYGWFFCVKILIDAGAKLNVANEWR